MENNELSANSVKFGMLYLVEVSLVNIKTNEKYKHKLIMIGHEKSDIENKLAWLFDKEKYKEIVISSIAKIRDKIHFLSTVILQPDQYKGPVIARDDKSQIVAQNKTLVCEYNPNLYAIGITTTMLGADENHAIRKLANALLSRSSSESSVGAAGLGSGSTIVIEEIPKTSGFEKARDVSKEANRAHIVRG